jgi:mono/diheme cytochrome c family protein
MTPAHTHYRASLSFGKILLLAVIVGAVVGIAGAQATKETESAANQSREASGKQTFAKYCASCHGIDATGKGPAAFAMRPPPADLTTLARRHEGKYPAGYIAALLQFGRSLAAHGSENMPVWGSRFGEIDPVHDPTGQRHIDDLVLYIGTLQVK